MLKTEGKQVVYTSEISETTHDLLMQHLRRYSTDDGPTSQDIANAAITHWIAVHRAWV